MSDRRVFVLINDRVRSNALEAVGFAPDGYVVTVSPRTRTLDQNAKLHAIIADVAASGTKWAGKTRTADEWKALFISAHAVATQQPGEVIPGIEGEFVAIRESSARMSPKRSASLIEYLISFCAQHGIELHETRRGGFLEERESA